MTTKILSLIVAAMTSLAATACWYSKSNYTDYLYAVNDHEVIHTNYIDGIIQYTITNNIVVDFPVTVSMKLIADQEINLNTVTKTNIAELVRGKLQYRVLPGGNWVTVQDYETKSGTIDKDSLPGTYFGRNNIWPKNCREGDVIMIRMYLTDGQWQSGDLDNLCEEKLTTIAGKRTLPTQFQYRMNGSDLTNYDLGGDWVPHLAITVIYSGHERPIR